MKTTYFNAIQGTIDREAGIIRGVSVLTTGEALGHGFEIDRTTLEEVKLAADSHKGGVKVKAKHGTEFDAIVGRLESFRIDGNQLRADLHMLKSHEQFPFIMELAEKQPESFGLSIAFSGKREKINGITYARCSELYSVDLVDEPAANPSGLFSAVDSSPFLEMDIKAFFSELRNFASESTSKTLSELQAAFDKLKAEHAQGVTDLATATQKIETLSKQLTEKDEAHKAELSKKDAEVKELASKEAGAILASMGIKKPLKQDNGSDNQGGTDLAAQLSAITDPAKRTEFFNKHKKEILAAAAASRK